MGKRITIEDCIEFALSKNGKCLSKEYIKSSFKLNWQCSEGHEWSASISSVKSGTWCAKCNMYSIEDCKNFALNKNGKCLSDFYKNMNEPMLWRCSSGHIWTATFNLLKGHGIWCTACSKINIGDCVKFAQDNNIECLSEKYIDRYTPLFWRCKNNHIWENSYHNIIQNINLCKLCENSKKLEEAKRMAISKNGMCIFNFTNGHLIKSYDKLKWRCEFNHEWQASYNSIMSGYWCPKCACHERLTIEECRYLALEKDGYCLSEKYENNNIKMKWMCGNGHIWDAKFSSIKYGSWCPECSTNKSQQIVKCFFEFVFKQEFIQIRPEWLIGYNNRPLELDGYCSQLNIAFEHQGRQHYEPIYGEESYLSLIKNDKLKKEYCDNLNIKLIIINYIRDIDDLIKYLKNEIYNFCMRYIEYNKYIININNFSENDIYIDYKNNKLEKIKEMAIKNGDSCISNVYCNTQSKLTFICCNNHEFKMCYANYLKIKTIACKECKKIGKNI